jgi:hypothetical protein
MSERKQELERLRDEFERKIVIANDRLAMLHDRLYGVNLELEQYARRLPEAPKKEPKK